MREQQIDTRGSVDLSTTKVISDTVFVSVSRLFVLLLKPLRGIVLGRLLGPTLYGLLNVPVPYVTILSLLANIGFSTAVVKLIPDYRQQGRADLARMIYRSTAVLTVVLSALWCVLLIIFSRWIAEHVIHRPDAVLPMRIYAFIIPFLAMNTIYGAAYMAVQRGKLQMRITIWHGLLSVLLPIAIIFWSRNVVLIIAGFLAAEVIGMILFAAFFRGEIDGGLGGTREPMMRGMQEVWTFGQRFFLASLGWNLILSIDKFMVQYFLPVEQYGFYYMSSLFITALTIVTTTVGLALVPPLTAAKTAGDTATFKKQVWNTGRLGFITLVPLVAAIYTLTGDLFSLILPKFTPSVPVIRILCFVGFLLVYCRVSWAALVAYGRGTAVSSAYAIAAAWNFTGNWILIPRYGIAGAAVATLGTFVMLSILLQYLMWRASGTRLSLTSMLHPLAISLAFPLLGWLLGGSNTILRIVVVAAAGSCIYAVFSILTGLVRRDDLAKTRAALQPRAAVPHVRLVLRFIGLLESFQRRITGR